MAQAGDDFEKGEAPRDCRCPGCAARRNPLSRTARSTRIRRIRLDAPLRRENDSRVATLGVSTRFLRLATLGSENKFRFRGVKDVQAHLGRHCFQDFGNLRAAPCQ